MQLTSKGTHCCVIHKLDFSMKNQSHMLSFCPFLLVNFLWVWSMRITTMTHTHTLPCNTHTTWRPNHNPETNWNNTALYANKLFIGVSSNNCFWIYIQLFIFTIKHKYLLYKKTPFFCSKTKFWCNLGKSLKILQKECILLLTTNSSSKSQFSFFVQKK